MLYDFNLVFLQVKLKIIYMNPIIHNTINSFMKSKKKDCIKIINAIPTDDFDSHEFIKYFMRCFELKYVEFLNSYTTEPFRNVNAQIAKFLCENQDDLSIKSKNTTKSLNVFGLLTQNELWTKI